MTYKEIHKYLWARITPIFKTYDFLGHLSDDGLMMMTMIMVMMTMMGWGDADGEM